MAYKKQGVKELEKLRNKKIPLFEFFSFIPRKPKIYKFWQVF